MEILPLTLSTSATIIDLQHQQKHHGSSIRSSSAASDKRVERRKPNWTECENVFLLDQFSLHREILTCKSTDASTNLRKQEVWRIICQNLNKQNVQVRRTPAEVRRKWKNLVTAAKKEVWEIRHQAHVTGASRKLSELSQRVLQLHSTTASAVALFMSGTREHGGVESERGGGGGAGSGRFYAGSGGAAAAAALNGGSPEPPDFDKIGGQNGGSYYGGSHFTPIVQFSESISSPNGNGSEMSSAESRNEFDSGIYEDAPHDLRVNKMAGGLASAGAERKTSDTTTEEIHEDHRIKMTNNEELVRVKLELQIEVLKLRKRKLEIEVRKLGRGAPIWRRNLANSDAKMFK